MARKLTRRSFDRFPDDLFRHEIIDGVHYKTELHAGDQLTTPLLPGIAIDLSALFVTAC